MWKLIATILAVTDTGAMSTSILATDYQNRLACEEASRLMTGSHLTTKTVGDKTITVKIDATSKCMFDGVVLETRGPYPPSRYPRDIPPPIAGMIEGFFNGIQR
jgi:hypothetical protein